MHMQYVQHNYTPHAWVSQASHQMVGLHFEHVGNYDRNGSGNAARDLPCPTWTLNTLVANNCISIPRAVCSGQEQRTPIQPMKLVTTWSRLKSVVFLCSTVSVTLCPGDSAALGMRYSKLIYVGGLFTSCHCKWCLVNKQHKNRDVRSNFEVQWLESHDSRNIT